MTTRGEARTPASTVEDALAQARSASWTDRLRSAEDLTRYPHDSRARARLTALLDDDDSAVAASTAYNLIAHLGVSGLTDVLSQMAFGEDDVGYFIRDQFVKLLVAGFPVVKQLEAFLHDNPTGPLHDEAAEIIDYLNAWRE